VGFFWATVASHTSLIIVGAFTAGTMLSFSRVWSSPFLMRHSSPLERSHVFSLCFAASLGSGLIAHLGAGSLHRILTPIAGSALVAYQWVLWIGSGCALLGAMAFTRIPHEVIVEQREHRSIKLILRTKGPLFFRLVFPSFLVGLGAGLIIPFLNLYFRDRFGLSTQTIGVYYALVQASMILGVMIGPEMARRYGMIRTIVVSELASLPFMVALAFTHNLPLATMAFLARGALMNLGSPIMSNYLMERVGPEDRATGNSLALLAWTSSWAIAAVFGGWMIEKSGYVWPLMLASGLYLVSSGMYYFYFRNEEMHAGRPAEGVFAVEAVE
jgi:predicted MFS family arabinose efflux permease